MSFPASPVIVAGDAFALLAGDSRRFACDALITDPPYSERTHRGAALMGAIPYASIGTEQVLQLGVLFCARTRGWICVFTDHTLIASWSHALADDGRRYVFAPVPLVTIAGRVRLRGDGPASWADYLIVSRPRSRSFAQWGALPGAYLATVSDRRSEHGRSVRGAKPVGAMLDIVRDYSRPGDRICDPFAGSGTTGRAAVNLQRSFIGCEIDPDRAEATQLRLSAEWELVRNIMEPTKGQRTA